MRYLINTKPYISYNHMLFIAEGCDQYMEQSGLWPTSLSRLSSFRSDLSDPWNRDGWGRELVLIPYQESVGFGALISYGADGEVGGDRLDRDLEVRFPLDANSEWNERMGAGLTKLDRRLY